MADIYAVSSSSFEPASHTETTTVSTILSALLIIGFPTLFWMTALEAANYLFGFELGLTARLVVAATLIGLLSTVWCFAILSARQRRSHRHATRLSA